MSEVGQPAAVPPADRDGEERVERNMNTIGRRDFLKRSVAVGAGLAGLPALPASAGPTNILSTRRMGVLVDTTVCIGCRNCEYACKKAHDLPTEPLASYEDWVGAAWAGPSA